MISKQAYHSAENPTYLSCNRGADDIEVVPERRDRSDDVVRWKVIMWVILFTAKLLIINFANSYIGQAFTEGCKKKKNCLDKRALWASLDKGAGAQAPSAPPSARAWPGA